MTRVRRRAVLVVSSGGGHWVQLQRLRPAFDDLDVVYATVSEGYAGDVAGARFRRIRDATRWSKSDLVCSAIQMAILMIRLRPAAVVTTGAAPGYLAVRLGKLFGARTLWLDSIANAEELSNAGERAGPYADLWLTQWPDIARRGGPEYRGAVL